MFSKYFIDFNRFLTSDERAIIDSVQEYSSAISPKIAHYFEEADTPLHWYQKLAELKLLGITLAKQQGGQNCRYLLYGLICQELEKIDSSLRTFVSVQSSLCLYPIAQFGTEAQQLKWLAAISKGHAIGCFGLTEPNSGSDPKSMQTFATKVNNGWILNGHKTWISLATIADMGLIWANTHEGIQCFLVELKDKSIEKRKLLHKGSLRAIDTGELIFQDCFIPDENLLPGTQRGLKSALQCLNQARFGIAWGAMGAAQHCFEIALSYCQTRKQFNKPLAQFQLVQKDLVDCFSEITKAHYWHLALAEMMDNELATPAMISLAKRNACHEALKIARTCRALLGANGIDLNQHIMRHLSNLETVVTYEGTENIHTLVVGQYLTGENAFY